MSSAAETSGDYRGEVYRGPVILQDGQVSVAVRAHLTGHFDPLDGKFHWRGRLEPDAGLSRFAVPGRSQVTLAIEGRDPVSARLAERDPWGGYSITGVGTPPYRLEPVDLELPPA